MVRLGFVFALLMLLAEGEFGNRFLRGTTAPAAGNRGGTAQIMDGGDPFPPPPKP